jgi:hypothetical protein
MGKIITLLFLLTAPVLLSQGSKLKYVVYDFDGLDLGQTDLPDGDYNNNDLHHSIAANPLQASEVLGDRVVKLDLSWQNGVGEFGKATMRYLELSVSQDKFSFYFYNPLSNSGSAKVQVMLLEDDNGNDIFDGSSDDKWSYTATIQQSGAWQLISVPLSSFTDANAEGNGVFDARYTSPGGMLFSVGFIFSKPTAASSADTYYMDMICFSEGDLPTGNTIMDLPSGVPGVQCALGALGGNPDPSQVPADIHSFLPTGKKIALVNWFEYYASTGTSANKLPGSEVETLIDNGYTPIITWESMYASYSRLDPVQPRLNDILGGGFDQYIDDFARKVKSYNGTVIMRIFHEFEGDWYPWSLSQNGHDPQRYINAYHYVVDRFRAVGANNVKWMWCLNAEPKPYSGFNWVVSCYPGDNYVDIVATDIYNHPDLGTPSWKSFRYTMAESYYYLTKYFPQKPLYVCEVGSRERNAGEPSSSQTKADWTCRMSKDLKTYFSETRALVFFSMVKEHDWRINSSEEARQAFVDCIWNDQYFGGVVSVEEEAAAGKLHAYPNPFVDELRLYSHGVPDTGSQMELRLFDVSGKVIYSYEGNQLPENISIGRTLPVGLYIIELRRGTEVQRTKLIKTYSR